MCSIKVIVEIFWYDPKWSSDRTHQKSLIQPLKVEVSGTNTSPQQTSKSIHIRFITVEVSAVKFSY